MNAKETVNKNKTTLLVITLLLTLLSPLYAQYFNVQNLDQRFIENLDRMGEIERMLSESWNPTFYTIGQPYSYVISKLGTYTCMQNGTTGKLDFKSTNSTSVIQNAWNNASSNGGGTVLVKQGSYSITYLTLLDGSGVGSVALIGENGFPSKKGVIFSSTSDYMITSNATAWVQGANGGFHSIENIYFNHTTQAATDTTLNLAWVMVNLKNLRIINANATAQGIGVYCGTNNDAATYTGNTGVTVIWDNINVASYDVNYNVSIDHLHARNILSYYPDNYAFNWRWSAWSVIANLQIVPETTKTNAYMLYFDYLGQGCEIYGLNIEYNSGIFNQTTITYINEWHQIEIDGFFMQGTLGLIDTAQMATFWNRTSSNSSANYLIHLNAYGGSYLSENRGSATLYNNTNTVSHGLLETPYFVSCISTNTTIAVIFTVAVAATTFTVYMTDDAGNALTGQSFRWFATVNR